MLRKSHKFGIKDILVKKFDPLHKNECSIWIISALIEGTDYIMNILLDRYEIKSGVKHTLMQFEGVKGFQ